MLTPEEIRTASKVCGRIDELKYYLTKERFVNIAKAKYDMKESRAEELFSLFGNLPSVLWRLETEHDAYKMDDILRAVQIAEEVNETLTNGPYNLDERWDSSDYPDVSEQIRRYYYIDTRKYGESYWQIPRHKLDIMSIDINVNISPDVLTLAELMKREGCRVIQSVKKLGTLERYDENGKRVEIPYFDGDIVFVYGIAHDRKNYSFFSDREDAGVYVALEREGFRKLLYVPKRGYVDREGELEYEDDNKYSRYKITGSCDSHNFEIVGNIYKDKSVLVDGRSKKKEAEDEDADE